LKSQQGNCNNLIKPPVRRWPDGGFVARLNFARQRYSTRELRKRDATHAAFADAIAKTGGAKLKDASWSQIFRGKQPISIRTALAIAELGDVPLGWLIRGDGPAPEGYVEPVIPPQRDVAATEDVPRCRRRHRRKRA
jgi:hypothetical protein